MILKKLRKEYAKKDKGIEKKRKEKQERKKKGKRHQTTSI